MTSTPDTGNEPPRPAVDGTLAPAAPGQASTTAIKLSRTQKILIGVVVAGVLTIATLGFIGSYAAVTQLAIAKGFGRFAHAFPIAVDAGIIAFLALDLLLTWLRMPYPMLRQGAWLLTAATISFNAAAAWPDPIGVGMHGVIPILFVIAVEAARHAIGRIADITANKHIESPPVARWLLNPLGTFLLWRRTRLWDIRSWATALQLEQGRRIYRAQLRKDYGFGWRRKATAEQLLVLKLTRDGMSVTEALALPAREEEERRAEQDRIDRDRKRAEDGRRREAEAERQELDDVEAKRQAEARAQAEVEAEAKHEAELRATEVEAKRRAELAEAEASEARARSEAEAAEAEAKHRSEVAAEVARLEVEAKRREGVEAGRLLVAETEAKLAAIARAEQEAEAEAELNRQRRVNEQAVLLAEAARRAREQQDAEARQRREQEVRERAQRIATRATTASTSASDTTSGPATKTTRTSGSASTSVSGITGPRAKKQAEVEAVLARMVEANDPEAVSLKWIEEHFDLKQTTAYDRLKTAQYLWAEVHNPKSAQSA